MRARRCSLIKLMQASSGRSHRPDLHFLRTDKLVIAKKACIASHHSTEGQTSGILSIPCSYGFPARL